MINIIREEILHKGYANKADIRRFIPCGHQISRKIFEEVIKSTNNENKTCLKKVILAKRLLPYVGLTQRQISEYAENEKKSLAVTSDKNN